MNNTWRKLLLAQMMGKTVLDADELSLFEWYMHEQANVINRMLPEERAFVQKQIDAGNIDAGADNDGWLIVEYYIKRVRYADVIYLTSLLEIYLARACDRLITILGDHNILFRIEDLAGDKWTKRKKFLERYGRFTFPKGTWSDLQILIRVRNILVHENGSISQSEKDQIQKCPGITVDRDELVIEDAYITHCLSAIRSLAEFVGKQIDQLVDRSQHLQGL